MKSWLAALSLTVTLGMAMPVFAAHLPFIADDYAHARAEAVQRQLPLVIEIWSPW